MPYMDTMGTTNDLGPIGESMNLGDGTVDGSEIRRSPDDYGKLEKYRMKFTTGFVYMF